MRQRSVNEKAVEKTIGFLNNLQILFDKKEKINISQLQINWGISKSTFSICKKLSIVLNYGENLWEFGGKDYGPNRSTAIKILESLRQRSDKQEDKPINDLWVQEISDIKRLLTEIRDNAKIEINGVDRLISSQEQRQKDRIEIINSLVKGFYGNEKAFTLFSGPESRCTFILNESELLLNKLYSK